MTSGQESNALLCSDGLDNDNDGLIDCDDDDCFSIPNDGCSSCIDGLSFADVLIEYRSGCELADQNPEGALGLSDFWGFNADEEEFVFLGKGGYLKLGFTNNILSNSGDSASDLLVFEIGPAIEPTAISLRPSNSYTESALIDFGLEDNDQDGFFYIADVLGATNALDIDEVLTGFAPGELTFDAIQITDLEDQECTGNAPGADIDAVCALYSLDCMGIQNGPAILDDCGVCIIPSSLDFNQSCTDCFGVVNGPAQIDSCGICLDPLDPIFNKTCIECPIYIPNVITSDEFRENNQFEFFTCPENSLTITSCKIYDRWGNLVFQVENIRLAESPLKWSGLNDSNRYNKGVYVYKIVVANTNSITETITGTITLL